MGTRLVFILVALVVSPVVGIVVSLLLKVDGSLVWVVLLGIPVALTFAVGTALRLGDGFVTLFSLLSAAAGFGFVVVWIFYALSQGAFE